MSTNPGSITLLLHRWRNGDHDAESELFRQLLPDLRRIARRCFRGERPGHTIQPTALVNEAFLRLAAARNIDWHDRGHFLAVSARMMRRHLIEHARHRTIRFAALDDVPEPATKPRTPLEIVITLDLLLDALDKISHRMCSVVELKFFLGLSDSETAEALHLSLRSTEREWHNARRWLFQRMSKDDWKSLSKTMNG